MDQPEKPVDWWGRGGVRKTRAIVFAVAVVLAFGAFFPGFSDFYDSHPVLKNLLAGLAFISTLLLAYLEYKHSGEANDHRAELNRLTGVNNVLYQETLKLQRDVHQLQQEIEGRLSKIRSYARVHRAKNELQLFVSNLSEFDLWLNQVEVIVTEGAKVEPHNHTIGGATRLSRGKMENGFLFWGTLMTINNNVADRFDMKFHLKVVVTGVEEKAETINSPKYQVKLVPGGTLELITLEH